MLKLKFESPFSTQMMNTDSHTHANTHTHTRTNNFYSQKSIASNLILPVIEFGRAPQHRNGSYGWAIKSLHLTKNGWWFLVIVDSSHLLCLFASVCLSFDLCIPSLWYVFKLQFNWWSLNKAMRNTIQLYWNSAIRWWLIKVY